MAGLVADYRSESEDEDSDSLQLSKNIPGNTTLPKPDFILQSDEGTKCSVFMNPFIEADNAKNAILEKHVKMISTDVKALNGKKTCWNNGKNKCRFGHNCKYAHDSDLKIEKSAMIQSTTEMKPINIKKNGESVNLDNCLMIKKKRSGISENTAPSKKVIRSYKKQNNLKWNK